MTLRTTAAGALVVLLSTLASTSEACAQTESKLVAEEPTKVERFGGGLPWWEWSRMTGDWGGLRSRLENAGVRFDSSYSTDWSKVVSGGHRRRGTNRSLLDLNLALDLEALFGLTGATIFVDYYSQVGRNASKDVGDIQGFGNIDSDNVHELAELWYEQRLFENWFRVKLGKVEANSEFAFVDNGVEFINSSMGFSPTIFVLPTYPDPATSINIFVTPTDTLYGGFGLYDGALQKGIPTGSRGPKTFFDGSGKLFFIGEVGGTWTIGNHKHPGRLGLRAGNVHIGDPKLHG